MFKVLVFLGLIFQASPGWSQSAALFQLYRTNYYPHRTMQYAVNFDASCQIQKQNPFRVYFVETGTGQPVDGFSNYNKEYFNPRQVRVSGAEAQFTFKSLESVSEKAGANYSLRLRLQKLGSRCVPQVDLFNGSGRAVDKLDTFVVEFDLNIAGQPKGFNWAAAYGQSAFCLVGQCQ